MRVREVARTFLWFGLTAFGGPAAHTALFETELVTKRRWMSRERFLERMALTQLIPGPNSTELAMHLGYERAGWAGFFTAGLCFLLPAALMVAALAEFYARGAQLPALARWLAGTRPVVAALIAVMLARTARTALAPSPRWLLLPSLLAFLPIPLGAPVFPCLMLGAALLFLARWRPLLLGAALAAGSLPLLLDWAALMPAAPAPTPASVFTQMLAIGSLVFGSGYVLYSYFARQLVQRLHWVSVETLAAAIAAGQLTPGPLFTSSTFLGQWLAGPWGAVSATAGIFAPAFFFGAISIPFSRRLEGTPLWREALLVLSATCILLLGYETALLLPKLVSSPAGGASFGVCALLLWRYRVNGSLLVLAGALLGWILPI